MKIGPLIILVCAWVVPLQAAGRTQTPGEDAKPREPLIRRMPAFASWKMEYKYLVSSDAGQQAAPPPSQPDVPVAVTVTKTRGVYREEIEWRSGARSERWIVDGMEFALLPGQSRFVPVTFGDGGRRHFAYDQADFKDIDWLSLDHYTGHTRHEGKDAYLFEDSESGAGRRVILSLDGQRPLLISTGLVETTYHYLPNPEVLLSPPAAIGQIGRRWQAGRRAASQPPSPP